jgi:hypothetical protein
MRAGVESNHQFKQWSGAREKNSKRKKKKNPKTCASL